MNSPESDRTSEGGGVLLRPKRSVKHSQLAEDPSSNSFMSALVPYNSAATPTPQPQSVTAMALFNDIRAACQSAQGRIMRIQQATGSNASLSSAIREKLFSDLREVAQCFITAQQASAKIEQSVNTERAQLQGALTAALNERDLMKAERDSANLEVQFLRGRNKELQEKVDEHQRQTQQRLQQAASGKEHVGKSVTFDLPTLTTKPKKEGWIYTYNPGKTQAQTSGQSGHGSSMSIDESFFDVLPSIPSAVEHMPLSPKSKNTTGHKNSFGMHDSDDKAVPGYNEPIKPPGPRPSSQGPQSNELSRFSNSRMPKNQLMQATAKNNNTSNSLTSQTPDLNNFRSVSRTNNNYSNGGGRLPPTPGYGFQGPFSPPPQQQPIQRPASVREHRDTEKALPAPKSAAVSMAVSKVEPARSLNSTRQHQREQSQSHSNSRPKTQTVAGNKNSTGGNSASSSRTPSASMELTLAQNDNAAAASSVPGVFAAGVEPTPGTHDVSRVRSIFMFFNSVKAWADNYCNNPEPTASKSLSSRFPRLWDYACSATYPNNRTNAASHALYMLDRPEYRTFFVARLLIQYVVQQMWSPTAWEGIEEKLTEQLVSIRKRLDPKYGFDAVVQPSERHALVEQRSNAIYELLRHDNWNRLKYVKVNQAVTRFKDIVGPLMNARDIDRQSALHELNSMGEEAFRLSAVLMTSRLSFQFIFNECGIKFSDQSHRSLNNTDIEVRELQARHWRLMCVVTPGITYRNDAGSSVDPRFLSKANVLVMK